MKIQCHRCAGTGQVPLSEELETTYRAVKSGLHTTKQIYNADAARKFMGRSAINRRLEKLFDLGLLWRQRRGKFIHFRIIKAKDFTKRRSGKPKRQAH